MLVGTSPAFDFGLFTVCFLAQKGDGGGGQDCTCSIGDTKLSFKVVPETSTAVKTAYPWYVAAV